MCCTVRRHTSLQDPFSYCNCLCSALMHPPCLLNDHMPGMCRRSLITHLCWTGCGNTSLEKRRGSRNGSRTLATTWVARAVQSSSVVSSCASDGPINSCQQGFHHTRPIFIVQAVTLQQGLMAWICRQAAPLLSARGALAHDSRH